MSKVYSYEDCQPVIKEAWFKAIKHLEDTLGDQYDYDATFYAFENFEDFVTQADHYWLYRKTNPQKAIDFFIQAELELNNRGDTL